MRTRTTPHPYPLIPHDVRPPPVERDRRSTVLNVTADWSLSHPLVRPVLSGQGVTLQACQTDILDLTKRISYLTRSLVVAGR